MKNSTYEQKKRYPSYTGYALEEEDIKKACKKSKMRGNAEWE